MDPIITNALMSFGAGFAGASFSKAQGPGRALDDLMTLVGFDKLHEVAEKKRVKRDLNIQLYKESIAQKIVEIPAENITEPPLSIVGPALDASKFYIEEEVLREMFSSIIAASMDNRLDDKVHTSFIDIIKQLSPHDALLLKKIKDINMHVGNPLPAMKMVIKEEDREKIIFPLMVVFTNSDDFQKNAISLNNLSRLGIIEINMGRWSTDDSNFDILRENYIIKDVLNTYPQMELTKGSYSVNNFGQNFIDICVH